MLAWWFIPIRRTAIHLLPTLGPEGQDFLSPARMPPPNYPGRLPAPLGPGLPAPAAGSGLPSPCHLYFAGAASTLQVPPLLGRCRLYFAGAASPSATSSHSSSSPPSPSPLSSSESLRLALRSCVMSLRTCKGEGGALIRANAHQVQLVTGRPIRLFQSGVFISCVCGVLLRCPRPRCPLAHLHVLACHVVGCLPIL